MKSNRIAFAVISLLVFGVFAASLLKIQLAHAQTDASSTDATPSEPAPSETAVQTPDMSSSASSPTPTTFTLVHAAGTKYIDYCTDGTTITAHPGDPAIAANFDKPDAPTPHCPDGMTWHHTSGMNAFDTPTGDLEIGQYALVNGAYIVHYPATTYTDATSTVEWSDRIVSGLMNDPVTNAPAPTSDPQEVAPPAPTEGALSSPADTSSSTGASNDTSSPAPDTSTPTEGQ